MLPRQSIPNVGRRAQTRKTMLVMRGSGVNGVGAAAAGLLHAIGEQKSPQRPRDSVAFDDNESACAENYGKSASLHPNDQPSQPYNQPSHPYNQPSHPYNLIIDRILRRHQVAHTQQTHNGPNAVSPRDKGASDNQSMPKAQNSTARGAHCRSDLHPSQRPKDLTQNAGSQPRWQASTERTRRWSEERPQRQHRQHSPNCRPHDQPASSLDLARGCVTERGHAGCDVSRCDASEGAVASLDTSRSELGVVTRGTCRVPNYRVTKKGEPDALDELLDYLWVYQGMGRQVLNLHMPREAWDRKLFNKPLKLPPIPKGNNSAALNPSDGGSSRRAENDGIRLERRTVSEPAYVIRSHEPAGSLASGSDLQSQQSETRYAGSESADHEAGGAALGARTRSHVVGGRREKMKLVVKMPVLTQEVSCADLLEKE